MRSAAAAQPRHFARGAAVALVLLGYAIHLGTLAHPFLLADNRQVWGRALGKQGVQSASEVVRVCVAAAALKPLGSCVDGGRSDAGVGPGLAGAVLAAWAAARAMLTSLSCRVGADE